MTPIWIQIICAVVTCAERGRRTERADCDRERKGRGGNGKDGSGDGKGLSEQQQNSSSHIREQRRFVCGGSKYKRGQCVCECYRCEYIRVKRIVIRERSGLKCFRCRFFRECRGRCKNCFRILCVGCCDK